MMKNRQQFECDQTKKMDAKYSGLLLYLQANSPCMGLVGSTENKILGGGGGGAL